MKKNLRHPLLGPMKLVYTNAKKQVFLFALVLLLTVPSPLNATNFAIGEGTDPVAITIQGKSMAPLLKDGAVISVIPFDCEKKTVPLPMRGDIVVFNSGASQSIPLIKRIAATSGDTLKLAPKGTVLVNGKAALDPSDKPYIASQLGGRMIALYEGIIPPDAYLVLGNPGTTDSGRFGLISCAQIIGIMKK